MRKIPVGDTDFALVDDEDYDLLNAFNWNYRDGYAETRAVIMGKRRHLAMHRMVINENNPWVLVDHADNNRLNNQKGNLRRFTPKENSNNTVANVRVEAWGEEKTIAEWCDDERCSVNYNVLQKRIKGGMPVELSILAEEGEI